MYKLFIFSLVSLYANFSFGAVCDTVIVGNGIRYEGQYPCGEGVLYSDSLGIYIGHFERGIPNEVCTHYKKNGHRYYGEFKDGEYSGRGIHFWKSGAVCEEFVKIAIRPDPAAVRRFRKAGNAVTRYKKSIYVGVCVKGQPNGDGILYIHKASGRKYYFMEGLFVDGKFASGLYSNSYGVFSTAGGNFTADYRKGNSDIEIYSQLELRYRYEFLKTLKPKKFPGATLTEEQRLFLDGKLSSEQILSIRKSQ